MGKDISFKNHDRFIHLGIAIAALRKMRGMSQEQLAEKAGISRSLISAIEAPGINTLSCRTTLRCCGRHWDNRLKNPDVLSICCIQVICCCSGKPCPHVC